MAKEITRHVKEPNAETYGLYEKFIELTKSSSERVFPNLGLPWTVVRRNRKEPNDCDLLFYRFQEHESPVATITHRGDSMVMLTYEIIQASPIRVVIVEKDVQGVLTRLIETLV